MARSVPATLQPGAVRDHGFHTVRIARVVPETPDAASFVLDVPAEHQAAFAYQAGQFCTFRVWIEGEPHLRCYSMSSAPGLGEPLQVTVKRVPGGLVSGWMLDHLHAGDEVDVTLPAGVFQLTERSDDLVALAAGSGITPVLSLVKSALATTGRSVRLLYANRDVDSTIFRAALDELAVAHGDRFRLEHHLDVDRGFVDGDAVRRFVEGAPGADVYVCGPGPFMDLVEATLVADGVEPDRIHIERFTPAEPAVEPEEVAGDADDDRPTMVTLELDGRTHRVEHRPGTTVLQTARQLGLSPPSSCEAGSCATCMAKVLDGAAKMHCNNALTDEEVAEGWVLTCQAVPTSPTISVRYGFEED